MKKVTIIFLISAYLFSTTGLSELAKINVLFEHYAETKKINSSIGFCEFLMEHYVTDDGNPNDNDTDAKLPFKSHDACSTVNAVFIPEQVATAITTEQSFVVNDFFPKDDSLIPTSFYTMVWHPPKVS